MVLFFGAIMSLRAMVCRLSSNEPGTKLEPDLHDAGPGPGLGCFEKKAAPHQGPLQRPQGQLEGGVWLGHFVQLSWRARCLMRSFSKPAVKVRVEISRRPIVLLSSHPRTWDNQDLTRRVCIQQGPGEGWQEGPWLSPRPSPLSKLATMPSLVVPWPPELVMLRL